MYFWRSHSSASWCRYVDLHKLCNVCKPFEMQVVTFGIIWSSVVLAILVCPVCDHCQPNINTSTRGYIFTRGYMCFFFWVQRPEQTVYTGAPLSGPLISLSV